MPFTIRDFQPADFDTLWHIDQQCFAPGIAYSRTELNFYIRRRASFTLLAVEASSDDPDSGQRKKSSPPIALAPVAGFIVAEAGRTSGHIITIDVIAQARRSGVGSLLLAAGIAEPAVGQRLVFQIGSDRRSGRTMATNVAAEPS